jgi:hypothetical protein
MMKSDEHWFVEFGWSRIIAAVAVLAASMFGLLAYVAWTDSEQSTNILVGFAVEVFAASVTAVLAYYTITRLTSVENALNLKSHVVEPIVDAIARNHSTVHAGVKTLPWGTLFDNSTDVFLIVQGWDGWKDYVGHSLGAFLGRGGKLHVVLPKTKLPDGRPHPHIKAIAARMNRSEQAQIDEIDNTRKVLEEFAGTVSSAAVRQLRFSHTEAMIWYCGIYFAPHTLVISSYQHMSFDKIADASPPSFVIHCATYPKLQQWFRGEWKKLTGLQS